jgi:hypothetical protein
MLPRAKCRAAFFGSEFTQVEFGLVKMLRRSVGGGVQQRRGNLGCGLSAGGWFAIGQRANEAGVGAGGFELVNLFFAGDIGESALLNQTDEAVARYAGH